MEGEERFTDEGGGCEVLVVVYQFSVFDEVSGSGSGERVSIFGELTCLRIPELFNSPPSA